MLRYCNERDRKLFIDGRDAMLEYGIFVEKGGYKGVVQMPSFKTLDTTEWEEFDGVEVDLLSPVLDTRQFQIQFCITNVRYAEDFFDDLATGAYHNFQFTELGKTYRLRMVSNGSFSSFIKLGNSLLPLLTISLLCHQEIRISLVRAKSDNQDMSLMESISLSSAHTFSEAQMIVSGKRRISVML